MDGYLNQRNLIPEGQLFEISYETLREDPLGSLADIYEQLDLGDFASVRSYAEERIERERRYQPYSYDYRAEDMDKVYRAWKRQIDLWGYAPVSPP